MVIHRGKVSIINFVACQGNKIVVALSKNFGVNSVYLIYHATDHHNNCHTPQPYVYDAVAISLIKHFPYYQLCSTVH